jgi:adenylate cyclase, class 2
MIEVEAKVKIKNPRKFIKTISKLAKFQGKIKKVDNYYTLENRKTYPKKSLRVRKYGDHYKVNFKRSFPYESNVHAKNELEFNVSDISNFLELISDFGFKPWLKKEKVTHLYNVKPNFNIEVNYVKKIGWFLEFEYLVSKKRHIKKARAEILRIMSIFDFKSKDIIKSGYTRLLWNKRK